MRVRGQRDRGAGPAEMRPPDTDTDTATGMRGDLNVAGDGILGDPRLHPRLPQLQANLHIGGDDKHQAVSN